MSYKQFTGNYSNIGDPCSVGCKAACSAWGTKPLVSLSVDGDGIDHVVRQTIRRSVLGVSSRLGIPFHDTAVRAYPCLLCSLINGHCLYLIAIGVVNPYRYYSGITVGQETNETLTEIKRKSNTLLVYLTHYDIQIGP